MRLVPNLQRPVAPPSRTRACRFEAEDVTEPTMRGRWASAGRPSAPPPAHARPKRTWAYSPFGADRAHWIHRGGAHRLAQATAAQPKHLPVPSAALGPLALTAARLAVTVVSWWWGSTPPSCGICSSPSTAYRSPESPIPSRAGGGGRLRDRRQAVFRPAVLLPYRLHRAGARRRGGAACAAGRNVPLQLATGPALMSRSRVARRAPYCCGARWSRSTAPLHSGRRGGHVRP